MKFHTQKEHILENLLPKRFPKKNYIDKAIVAPVFQVTLQKKSASGFDKAVNQTNVSRWLPFALFFCCVLVFVCKKKQSNVWRKRQQQKKRKSSHLRRNSWKKRSFPRNILANHPLAHSKYLVKESGKDDHVETTFSKGLWRKVNWSQKLKIIKYLYHIYIFL